MSVYDPKYDFRDGRVFNVASGEVIPEDEPVFVFRARDRKAIDHALIPYMLAAADPHHARAVQKRIEDFERFARNHPERMKEPDTAALQPSPSCSGETR